MKNKRLLHSLRHALDGVAYCIRIERNMRLHGAAALAAVALGWRCQLTAAEWALLILTIAGVLAAEMFNTAIETVVDLVSPEYHPLAKIAKDVAAAAVLCMAAAALAVAYWLFAAKIF